MIIYIVFAYTKTIRYLTQKVCDTEKDAKKTISRLQKLDKKFNSGYEGYFYETWEVGKEAKRIQTFLESRRV